MTPSDGSLPRLALVYGGSAYDHSPLRFAEAAAGVCSLIWVLPPTSEPEDRATLRFLRRLGDVADVSEVSIDEAAAEIRALNPAGITCFVDGLIPWAAEISDLLGSSYYDRATASRLTDKLAQRAAIREHGLPTPPFWDADDVAADGGLVTAIAAELPVVLKPRRGTSSQDTERIDSAELLREAITSFRPGRMLLEGYIPDPSAPRMGAGSAEYASVELVVSGSIVEVLGVTGRTPLAPPFRETGFLFPADASPALASELAAAATTAVHALGVVNGLLHVELKCTDAGPVVIEVNGRPGGAGVHYLLRRSLGVDTVQLAMRVAVGLPVEVDDLRRPEDVSFRLDVQPDADIRTITSVEGLDEVLRIPGVDQVIPGVGPGDRISWRRGTLGYAAAVLGSAPDHPAVSRIRDEVLRRIVITGEP